jgi:hypothetical protein
VWIAGAREYGADPSGLVVRRGLFSRDTSSAIELNGPTLQNVVTVFVGFPEPVSDNCKLDYVLAKYRTGG